MTSNWDTPAARELIARALEEDIGPGDLTSEACVPQAAQARGRFLAKQDLQVAGIELLPLVYIGSFDPRILESSGRWVTAGTLVAEVSGPARLLLERERVALNFLTHLCGIATLTRRFVERAQGVTILDTRKTLPGLRALEKLAVAAGGGRNHRLGLYDAVLIKENHIAAAGGIRRALEAVKNGSVPVEIEVRNLEELSQALDAGATAVLLDNFAPETIRRAVDLCRGHARVEVSGGVTLENIAAYAAARPDFISIGALTHSAPAADITFLIDSLIP